MHLPFRAVALFAVVVLLADGQVQADAPLEAPEPPPSPEAAEPAPSASGVGEPEAQPETGSASEEVVSPDSEAPVEAPMPEESPEAEGTAAPSEPDEDTGESDGANAAKPGDAIDNERDEPDEPIMVAPPPSGPTEDDADYAACEAELRALGAVYEAMEPIEGEGPCGAPRPVRLTSLAGIEFRPAAELRCGVALSLALWVDRVVAPLADLYMDDSLAAVLIGTDYQCRRRRGDGTAKWSEHAFANAVDVSGVMFESGDVLGIQERSGSAEAARSFQAGVRGGACAFFPTVLGPTTNASHADHLHLDMAERTAGYRLCE